MTNASTSKYSTRKTWLIIIASGVLLCLLGWLCLNYILKEPVVTSLRFSPDSKFLAASGGFISPHEGDDMGGRVWVWDVAAGRFAQSLSFARSIDSVDFSSDNKLLIAGQRSGDNSYVYSLWKVATWQSQPLGSALPTMPQTWDKRIFMPTAKTQGWETQLQHLFDSHPKMEAVLLTLSLDGSKIALSTPNLEVWDLAKGKLLYSIAVHSSAIVYPAAFSPDAKVLAFGQGRVIVLWDLAKGKAIKTLPARITSGLLAFSPDGQKLASTNGTNIRGTISVWEVKTGNLLDTLNPYF